MITYKSLIAIGISMFGSIALRNPETLQTAKSIYAVYKEPVVVKSQPRIMAGGTVEFMKALARAESNNRVDIVNSKGMLGKYQFSPRTLVGLGFEVSRDSFLSDEQLQDSAMLMNMRRNYNRLLPVIREYRGKWRDGVYITTSGILAGAHLVGVGGVLAYFYPEIYGSTYIIEDSNGVHITDYMRRFGNYNIRL